jgi:hypothetical protein
MLLRISESGFDHLPDDLGQEAAYRLFGPEDDRDGDSDLWKIALPLALAGDSASAEKLAKELNENYPQHTIIQRYWLPIIHAAIVLEHTNADQFCFLCIALTLARCANMIRLNFHPGACHGQSRSTRIPL